MTTTKAEKAITKLYQARNRAVALLEGLGLNDAAHLVFRAFEQAVDEIRADCYDEGEESTAAQAGKETR